jgi:3-oxoacyl-(acyl-carrier-protein) synthase
VDLVGVGIWSESFSGWEQFLAVVNGASVEADSKLQPELIPARERRRAPQFVKMAVEVMDQACSMADVDRSTVATVFGSGMGDMEITDYMCRTLATMPRAISPTKFHN